MRAVVVGGLEAVCILELLRGRRRSTAHANIGRDMRSGLGVAAAGAQDNSGEGYNTNEFCQEANRCGSGHNCVSREITKHL